MKTHYTLFVVTAILLNSCITGHAQNTRTSLSTADFALLQQKKG